MKSVEWVGEMPGHWRMSWVLGMYSELFSEWKLTL